MHKAGKEVVGNVLGACVKARYPRYLSINPLEKGNFLRGLMRVTGNPYEMRGGCG